MRSGPNNRRSRGRGNGGRRGGSPRNQNFDSSGPEIKVRGSAQQVVDKYMALAREASTAGDPIKAEGYFQHAEHYFRILNANNQDGNKQQRNSEASANEPNAEANGAVKANGEAGANGAANGAPENGANGADTDPAAQEQPEIVEAASEKPSRPRRRSKNGAANGAAVSDDETETSSGAEAGEQPSEGA